MSKVSTPRCVVFDLGKVLLDFDYRIAARALAASCATEAEEFMAHFAAGPWLWKYELGHVTRAEFYKQTCAFSGYQGSLDQFAASFADIFSPMQPMVELQAALRRKQVPTYIFSNTNDIAIQHIRNNFPFFANFDGYVLSYEVKSMKPDPEIYAAVEAMTGRRGSDILYIDDRPENIETGERLGWQTILQEAPEKTIAQVKKVGLLPPDWAPAVN